MPNDFLQILHLNNESALDYVLQLREVQLKSKIIDFCLNFWSESWLFFLPSYKLC